MGVAMLKPTSPNSTACDTLLNIIQEMQGQPELRTWEHATHIVLRRNRICPHYSHYAVLFTEPVSGAVPLATAGPGFSAGFVRGGHAVGLAASVGPARVPGSLAAFPG